MFHSLDLVLGQLTFLGSFRNFSMFVQIITPEFTLISFLIVVTMSLPIFLTFDFDESDIFFRDRADIDLCT